jgi:tetratricopeptide (TPR) repeat protein
MHDLAEPAANAARAESVTQTGQLGLYELRGGEVLAGRFRIASMLGIGGMGVVYRAHDESLDVDVAIKLLRPELARKPEAFERFRQELLLARQVSSPHVVRIHDIAQDNGRWFISMDFIDGQSLEKRLDGAGQLPPDDAVAIAHDLLDGLSAAQQRGVVHRDLKPANILLDADGAAYITDFGVARSLGATGVTGSGVIVGTPEYLSPEQARGEDVDSRSDLYAVGLIVYEMLAGHLPFNAGTPAETVMQRIVRPPPSLAKTRPDLPNWLHAFVDRLLKLNPAHRFASAQEALRALESRRVPRAPIDRRIPLLAMLMLVAIAGAFAWRARHPSSVPAATAVVPATPQVAVLPFAFDGADPGLAPLARAFDAHATAWLRNDAALAVIPRRRVQHAIARTAPDAHGADLLRLLPGVASAANATRVLHGELNKTVDGLELRLGISPSVGAAADAFVLKGRDAAALFAEYTARMPAFFAANGMHPRSMPVLSAANFAVYGQALSNLDGQQFDAAAKTLNAVQPDPDSALLAAAQLAAEEGTQQTLPAQNRRESIIRDFANAKDPVALELYAQALAGDGQDDIAARALAQAVKDYPHDAELILADADSLRTGGKDDAAITLLKSYVAVAGDDAQAWFLLGRTAIEQGNARPAVEDYLLHAQTLDTLARDSAAEAQTRNALGIGYERLGQLKAAADEYERAATIREQLGDRTALARTLRNLAIVQAEQGARDEADRTLARAQQLLVELGDRASLGDLYNDRGVVAEEAGDFSAALAAYRQAFALRQQTDDSEAQAESLNNIGFASYRMGDFDNATVYWKQALEQYRKLGDRTGTLHITQSMALLDIAHGQFATARAALIESRNDAQQHQMPEETAVADISLAELALLEGRYAAGQTAVDEAARLFARRSDERGRAEAALLQARFALALGDARQAGKLLDTIDVKQLNREQLAEFQLAVAQQAQINGDPKAAATSLNAAADAAAKAHGGALAFRVELERARLALASNDIKHANALLADIGKQTARLNEVPLRLAWLELEIAANLRGGKKTAAAGAYRQTLPLIKRAGQYAFAGTVHELGARALGGTEARAASDAAAAVKTRILADAPEAARAMLQAHWQQRLQTEAGETHAP